MGSTKVTDEKLDSVLARIAPCTLPPAAWGSEPVQWHKAGVRVYAWITWPHQAAERVAAIATGWNDRIVIVRWQGDRGTWETVVWRTAVAKPSRAQR